MREKSLVLLLLVAAAVLPTISGYRLNVPRVLLPYYPKNQVSYVLEVKEPDGGCFFWKSTRPNIVSVEMIDPERGCSDKAVITARSRHSAEQSAVILATDHAGEVSLSCDVRVDLVERINIFTTTGFLFLEGPPAKIQAHGFNARGNQFSTLGSIPFEWSLKSADSTDRRPLRIVSFSDSNYQVPFGIAELEAQKKRGSELLLEGVQTGKAELKAKIVDSEFTHVPPASTELFVVQKAILIPSEDLFVPVGAIVNYGVVILKQSGLEPVPLPSPQYRMTVTNDAVGRWDEQKSQLIAQQVGHTDLTLVDTTFEEISKDVFEYVRVTVLEPDSLGFVVDRGDNWHFQLDIDYKIHVKLFDIDGNELFIPENANFKTNFESDHLKVLESSANGTYFHVRAQKTGITHINSVFYELIGEDGTAQPFEVRINGRQKIEISPPIKVAPQVLIFPHDPKAHYEYRLKATGGSGIYTWTSENKNTAVVSEDGTIRSGALGEAVIHVEDYRNPLHYDLAKVLVVAPTEVAFGPSPVEAEIGAELTLNIKLSGRLNDEQNNALVPFADCRRADFQFGLQDTKFFQVDTEKKAEIPADGHGCRTVTLRALASGDTRITVWFGHLTATLDISAYPPLKVATNPELLLTLGAAAPVWFEGGPRPWLLDPSRHFSQLEAADAEVAAVVPHEETSQVFCKEVVSDTTIKIRVGNRKSATNPFPAVATAEIPLCCAIPSRLALFLRNRSGRTNLDSCPASSLSIHCTEPADLELRGFGTCGEQAAEREFNSISSLIVEYKAEQSDLAKVHALESTEEDKLFSQVEPKGKPGRLVTRATAVGFHSLGSKSSKHKHPLPDGHAKLQTELSLQLVNYVEAHPSAHVVLWNQPSARAVVQLRGGSGHFWLDSAELAPFVNVELKQTEGDTTAVEIRPLKKGTLSRFQLFKLPVVDLCIAGEPLELSVKITEIGAIRLEGAQKCDLCQQAPLRVRVYDIEGQEFPAEDVRRLHFDIELGNNFFHVERIALSENADDSVTVGVKYPGETVFSVWEADDPRLAETFPSLPATKNVLAARNSVHSEPIYGPSQGSQLVASCDRPGGFTTIRSSAFGLSGVLGEFFDRNLGIFIFLLTIGVTISTVSAIVWLCCAFRPTRVIRTPGNSVIYAHEIGDGSYTILPRD